jgi:hypothetical protein
MLDFIYREWKTLLEGMNSMLVDDVWVHNSEESNDHRDHSEANRPRVTVGKKSNARVL